eukprot:TRINITY_DN48655_c0_g1_i1.p1 TRINITY_DN48655_c0_g1~~TRINITY_DN48655_c0_g1_i1.p1  ORF type:complete len:253 (-),score=33.10 TRINITY_DN48655_c0_g1_i1:195-902(-)
MPRSSMYVYVHEPDSPGSPKSNRSSFGEPESPRSPHSRHSDRPHSRHSERPTSRQSERTGASKAQSIGMKHYKLDRERQIGPLMRKFARTTGSLGREELRCVLEYLSEGNEVSDDDVDHIMLACDSRKLGFLNESELLFAVKVWTEHVCFLPLLEDWMLKYDADNSGFICKAELACLMRDMQGKAPTDKEVDWVMKQADPSGRERIGKWEIMRATTAWNYRIQMKKSQSRSCVLS